MHPDHKFKQRYNPKSNRLESFDYSQNGGYFVTICTKDRENIFGEIRDGEMILNEYGEIVLDEILETEKMRKNIIIDEFVIMPNHIHLIIMIENNDNNCDTDICRNMPICRDVLAKRLYSSNEFYSNISPKTGTIGNVIKLFKGYTTKRINKLEKIYFSWQPNYYDHIIRNEDELRRIRQYILENPIKWELDKDNPANLHM